MEIELLNKHIKWKAVASILLIVSYWFYLSLGFGYFLSKIFYNFLENRDKIILSKKIKSRENINLKNIKRFVISYVLKFLKNWIKRIFKKSLLLLRAMYVLINVLKSFKKKFKSILKFKSNFRLLKKLLPIFEGVGALLQSFLDEVFFLHNIIRMGIKWKQFILFLMSEYLIITGIVYFLYMILLGIFGLLLGFLLGLYIKRDDIYIFTLMENLYVLLLLFLSEMHNNNLDYALLAFKKADQFSKFSLKTVDQVNSCPLKITLREPDPRFQIPFTILSDLFVSIDIYSIYEESSNSKFELFKLYRNVNEKVKF